MLWAQGTMPITCTEMIIRGYSDIVLYARKHTLWIACSRSFSINGGFWYNNIVCIWLPQLSTFYLKRGQIEVLAVKRRTSGNLSKFGETVQFCLNNDKIVAFNKQLQSIHTVSQKQLWSILLLKHYYPRHAGAKNVLLTIKIPSREHFGMYI